MHACIHCVYIHCLNVCLYVSIVYMYVLFDQDLRCVKHYIYNKIMARTHGLYGLYMESYYICDFLYLYLYHIDTHGYQYA
jgi:hypothetical protein